MRLSKRYAYAPILVSSLMLTGFSDFKCADDSAGGSSGGSSGTRIRVSDEQKISANSGAFNGNLDNGDQFGSAIADTGDLEADGVRDLAVGAPFDDDDGNDRGAIWQRAFKCGNGFCHIIIR